MLVGEIMKWIKTTQKDAELHFYRTRSGLELDILIQTENGIIGMEIKARKQITSLDLRAMKEVALGLGKEWQGGMVIYQGNPIKKMQSQTFGPSHREDYLFKERSYERRL